MSIVHGTADTTVPFTEAEALRDAYRRTGVAFAFHPILGANHSPWSATVEGLTLEQLTAQIAHSVKPADAIQLACAAAAKVDLFLTNDVDLTQKTIPEIPFLTTIDRAPL